MANSPFPPFSPPFPHEPSKANSLSPSWTAFSVWLSHEPHPPFPFFPPLYLSRRKIIPLTVEGKPFEVKMSPLFPHTISVRSAPPFFWVDLRPKRSSQEVAGPPWQREEAKSLLPQIWQNFSSLFRCNSLPGSKATPC